MVGARKPAAQKSDALGAVLAPTGEQQNVERSIASHRRALGETVVTRMRYMFQLAGGVLQMQWTCPPSDGGVASQVVTYASDGRSMRFAILPGTHGDTVFTP